MKKLFFLLLILGAGGAWLFIPQEKLKESGQALVEKAVNLYAGKGGSTELIDSHLNEKWGTCHPTDMSSRASPAKIAGARFPFAESTTLNSNRGIECEFSAFGKFSLFPSPEVKLTGYRTEGAPAVIAVERGSFQINSEKTKFVLRLPWMDLTLSAEGPLTLFVQDNGAQTALLLQRGNLAIETSPRSGANTAARVVELKLMQGATVTSRGALLSNKNPLRLLPAGPQVLSDAETTKFVPLPDLSPAMVAAQTPKKNFLLTWLTQQTNPLDREKRIKLATLFPKVFGIHILCQFTPVGAAPTTVLPGEWIDSPAGGSLRCPQSHEVTAEKETRFRLDQSADVALFYLEKGRILVQLGNDPAFLETSGFSAGVKGIGRAQALLIEASPTEQALRCEYGSVEMDFTSTAAEGIKQTLFSDQCRVELALNGGAIKRYILAGDRVQAANLAVPRRFWPMEAAPAAAQGQDGVQISRAPASELAAFRLAWSVPATFRPKSTCTLFAQKSDAEVARKLQKFEVNAARGVLNVDPSEENSYLSIACEDEKSTLSSSVLLPESPNLFGTQ